MTSSTASQVLHRILNGEVVAADEVESVFAAIAAGEFEPIEIAGLLCTLKTRGETPEEIAAAARAFTAAAVAFPRTDQEVIDCVGTGGDGACTINISTGAALIAAAGGLQVVKHGNRSVSSRSGAADVLEALGIELNLSPADAAAQLETTGFTFLFAPAYHPGFKHVMPVRKGLGIPTIFNVLGPLLNPARPELQLMGTARKELGPQLIEAMRQLGRRRALVVHGSGLDEIALHGPTSVWELKDGEITEYEVTAEQLGLAGCSVADLEGGDGVDNARMMLECFFGRGQQAHLDAMLASAGALFYLAGRADSLREGVDVARTLVSTGVVARWAEQFLPRAAELSK
ncbi:anthranilate phosphoribosyltransferase [Corynebacterium aquilae]|uniref:Anthranilate phosphoribosyltransferase n=1 Tax=Corynebacterium aquilae DSM 44791 TaxID=1431546 RepID=A0A1L7CIP8_9CORY|nr:anthranilate phosphoribosyltransferase [Corynebacterium aquilae]APT85731.1 anthranilate phosphoribosyltransferase [Corynebacterium aquilae DSM 44791]